MVFKSRGLDELQAQIRERTTQGPSTSLSSDHLSCPPVFASLLRCPPTAVPHLDPSALCSSPVLSEEVLMDPRIPPSPHRAALLQGAPETQCFGVWRVGSKLAWRKQVVMAMDSESEGPLIWLGAVYVSERCSEKMFSSKIQR